MKKKPMKSERLSESIRFRNPYHDVQCNCDDCKFARSDEGMRKRPVKPGKLINIPYEVSGFDCDDKYWYTPDNIGLLCKVCQDQLIMDRNEMKEDYVGFNMKILRWCKKHILHCGDELTFADYEDLPYGERFDIHRDGDADVTDHFIGNKGEALGSLCIYVSCKEHGRLWIAGADYGSGEGKACKKCCMKGLKCCTKGL